MRNKFAIAGILAAMLFITSVSIGAKKSRPLHEKSFDEIIRGYTFVGDFSLKSEARDIGDELFWPYKMDIAKDEFQFDLNDKSLSTRLPATHGSGRAVAHINRGRVLLLEKNWLEARNTFLTAKARFGKGYKYHRRVDFLIGYSFIRLAMQTKKDKNIPWKDRRVQSLMASAGTFLSYSFIVKEDEKDQLLDKWAPKMFYNLAALYWLYDRPAAAYGAAEKGMNYLRKTGRKEYRPQFRRLLAEAYIMNRTYLQAVQQLDSAIRQDQDPKIAGKMFARVGDIYFLQKNYELAEDVYALGARIDEEVGQIHPVQFVRRGESLFWLGRFDEAQKMFHYALEGASYRKSFKQLMEPLSNYLRSIASLRIADSYLAKKNLKKAKLEYFRVSHNHPNSLAGKIARIRRACLELPEYGGQNVKHARKLLEEGKTEGLDSKAIELAWACQVASYTKRERTEKMLDRVRVFAGHYPQSRFLKSMVTPVRETQAAKIKGYFDRREYYKAVDFFEKNRKNLFPKVSEKLAQKLFVAYVDVYRTDHAAEFWKFHKKLPDTDTRLLREAVVAAEMVDTIKGKKAKKVWKKRNEYFAKSLVKREWKTEAGEISRNYFQRLLTTKTYPKHLPWMYKLATYWTKKNSKYTCNLLYPVVSRMHKSASGKKVLDANIDNMISGSLPALFSSDLSCSMSLLELESDAYSKRKADLAIKYLNRTEWPMNSGFVTLYWSLAEEINESGDTNTARKMWNVILAKGPKDSVEVKFAKSRLDPRKTQFEKLWGN